MEYDSFYFTIQSYESLIRQNLFQIIVRNQIRSYTIIIELDQKNSIRIISCFIVFITLQLTLDFGGHSPSFFYIFLCAVGCGGQPWLSNCQLGAVASKARLQPSAESLLFGWGSCQKLGIDASLLSWALLTTKMAMAESCT